MVAAALDEPCADERAVELPAVRARERDLGKARVAGLVTGDVVALLVALVAHNEKGRFVARPDVDEVVGVA